jgi:hypothetical protein
LDEVIVEVDDTRSFIHWVRRPSHELRLSRAVALALRLAFREVLFNSHNEALNMSRSKVNLYYDEGELGGCRFARISLQNPVKFALSKKHEEQLYRLPVRHGEPDRPHIGAFIAGSLLRAIGGDIYLAVNDGRIVKTVLEIPLERVAPS